MLDYKGVNNMTDTELTAKLADLENRILYLEQQQQPFPFGTWKEYPPTQAAPQACQYNETPSYHCTYEHP